MNTFKRDPLTQTKLQTFFKKASDVNSEQNNTSDESDQDGGLAIDNDESRDVCNDTSTTIQPIENNNDTTLKISEAVSPSSDYEKSDRTFVINITLQGVPSKSKPTQEHKKDVETDLKSPDKLKPVAKRKIKALFGESSESDEESNEPKRKKTSPSQHSQEHHHHKHKHKHKKNYTKEKEEKRIDTEKHKEKQKIDTEKHKEGRKSDTDKHKEDKKSDTNKQKEDKKSDADKHKEEKKSDKDKHREKKLQTDKIKEEKKSVVQKQKEQKKLDRNKHREEKKQDRHHKKDKNHDTEQKNEDAEHKDSSFIDNKTSLSGEASDSEDGEKPLVIDDGTDLHHDNEMKSDDTSQEQNTSPKSESNQSDKELQLEPYENDQNKLNQSTSYVQVVEEKKLSKAHRLSLEADKVLEKLKQFAEMPQEPIIPEEPVKETKPTSPSPVKIEIPTSRHNRLSLSKTKEHRDKERSEKKSRMKEKRKEDKKEKKEKVDMASLVVKLLMPYYKKKKISNRDLFKITARHIVHQLMAIQVTGMLFMLICYFEYETYDNRRNDNNSTTVFSLQRKQLSICY